MVSAPRPTRAEATDVANAVLDGVDALLLGAETLRGANPVVCVQTVLACCQAAEAVFDHNHHFDHLMKEGLKAEETGIFVPGGADSDTSPDASMHGSQNALTATKPAAMPVSASHANLTTQVAVMTQFAQGSMLTTHNSNNSMPPPSPSLSSLIFLIPGAYHVCQTFPRFTYVLRTAQRVLFPKNVLY